MDYISTYLQNGWDFLFSLGWPRLVRIYWYYFYLELPRYLLAGLAVFILRPGAKKARAGKIAFRERLKADPPLVSIIVPAYNEAQNLAATLDSLLAQSYPRREIIVVDDGSEDDTATVCGPYAASRQIRFFSNRRRGGKSSALNLGLQYSRGSYIMQVDADTLFDKDALSEILPEFSDERVGAVSGALRISNHRQNLLTALQEINYLFSISLGRLISSRLNILMIVSGAFGVYKRELLERSGGWDVGPGEDGDLTQKIRKLGARIAFAPRALCRTKAPATIRGFVKQRRRWNRTMIRGRLRKHRDVFNPRQSNFRWSNFIGAADILFFKVLLSYNFLCYLAWLFIYYRPMAVFILFTTYLLYLAAGLGQFLLAGLFYGWSRRELRLLLYLPLYSLFNCYFLRFIRLWAYTEEIFWQRSYQDSQVPSRVLERAPRW